MTWDQLRSEIAQALGKGADDVPQPGTQEFNHMMGLLLDTHPDLAARVQAWLVQSTEPVASQAAILAEARKAEARQRLASLFTKRDHTQPHRRRLNKPAVIAAIVAGIALLWLVGRMHQAPPSPLAARGPHRPAAAQAPAPQPVVPAPPQQPKPQAAPPKQAQASPAGPPPSSPLPTPPLPLIPPGPAQVPPPAQAGTGGPSREAASAPVVVGAQGGQERQASEAVHVVVGAASATAETTVVSAAPAKGGGESGGQQGGGATVVAPSAQGQGAAPSPSASQSQSPAPAGAGTPARATPHFQVGDRFTVRLMTPLAVSTAWQAIPAVAQAEDGPIAGWQVIGNASQGQDGSLQISWTQALSPDRSTTIQLHGVAYDPSLGKPGVPGATSSVMAPQAARTALAGALGAVSQYVQDQIQAQQTQVSGLTATITSQVPPFWQILAQQLATGFQPAPVQAGGTVMVTRVPAGTPIVVFITAAGP